MKKIIRITMLVIIFLLICLAKNVYGATTIRPSKTTVEPGEKITVTVTVSGVATWDVHVSASGPVSGGSINLVGDSGNLKNGSATATGTFTATGEGTIKFTTTSGSTGVTENGKYGNVKGSSSVTVKKKEAQVVKPPETTTKPENEDKKNDNNTGSSTKNTNTSDSNSKNNNSKQTEKKENNNEKKEEEKVDDQEEATPQFGITTLYLKGYKENDEMVEIPFTSDFNINVYEYWCNVSSEIKRIELAKEAYEYNDYIEVIGADEELKDGENIIQLKMNKEGEQELIYTIHINKEGDKIEEEKQPEVVQNEEKVKKEPIMVTMPLFWFIVMILGIVIIEAVVIIFINKKIKR